MLVSPYFEQVQDTSHTIVSSQTKSGNPLSVILKTYFSFIWCFVLVMLHNYSINITQVYKNILYKLIHK